MKIKAINAFRNLKKKLIYTHQKAAISCKIYIKLSTTKKSKCLEYRTDFQDFSTTIYNIENPDLIVENNRIDAYFRAGQVK